MEKKLRKRRSDTRNNTREGRVLKTLRQSRKLSMRDAAELIGKSNTLVCHAENGRLDLTEVYIEDFLRAYGYSKKYFDQLILGSNESDEYILVESLEIVKNLPTEKLRAVYSMLKSFL